MSTRAPLISCLCLALAAALAGGQQGMSAEQLEDRIQHLRTQGRYSEAAETATELLAVRQADPGTRAYELADAKRLAESLQQIARLPEESRRELASADSLQYVDDTCWEEGRYADGVAAVERQLEIRRRLLGSEHPDVALSLSSLASFLSELGDYARAEPLLREALEIDRRALGEEHPYMATDISNLGMSLLNRADYAGAEPLFREALSLQMRILGREHEDVALTLNNLGCALHARGDYASAEPLLREALAIRRRLFGNEHQDVAVSLTNLASLLGDLGDDVGAEPLLREALEIERRLLGERHPDVGMTLGNLGGLLYARGDYAGAERHFREALATSRGAFGTEHRHVATDMSNLAMALLARGDHAGAEQLLRETLEMQRRLLGDESPEVARSLNNLGGALFALGDHAAAERSFREALAMNSRLLGSEHPAVAQDLDNVAQILEAQGRRAEAEQMLTEEARVYDAARLRVGAGIERSTFLPSPYPQLASVRLILGDEERAWPAAEKALGRSLADLLVASRQRELADSERATEDSLKRVLGTCERELAAYREAARADTSREAARREEEARSALLAAEAGWSAFQRGMAAKYPVTEGQTYPLGRVQAALSRETAIVGWLDVSTAKWEQESWCYAIRDSGPVTWAPAGAVPDEDGVQDSWATPRALRDVLARPSSAGRDVVWQSRQLWTERMEPLAPTLEGVTHLIVIPSGPMLGVPVEALADDQGVLVGGRYAVSYAPSATIHTWLAEARSGAPPAPRERMLLVGDPPFNADQAVVMGFEGEREASRRGLPGADTLRGAAAGNEAALAALPRLRGSREEVNGIARLSPGATVLVGPEATEQALAQFAESRAMSEFGVVHLATHALVDDERPERSTLVLSQLGLPNALEAALEGARIYDGVVTAEEILREWDLNAELVTLSACETGLGKQVMGEGYIGFAHALLQAGARSLMVSLWEVEDESTALLMSRFYENWLGAYEGERGGRVGGRMSKAEALREAKAWLQGYEDERGGHPYESPYFWSPFILVGGPD